VTLPMLFIAAILILDLGEMGISIFIEMTTVLILAITLVLAVKAWRGRDREVRTILKESSPVLVFCILLDIGAGLALNQHLASLVTLPAIIVLVPPFLEEANALGGILTSRLGSLRSWRRPTHWGGYSPPGSAPSFTWV